MWLPHFEIMFNSRRILRVRSACVSGVVVFAAFLIGCSTKPMPTKPATLRVMTYNIHHGEGLDGQVDLLRIAQLIQREGADIVALQEVDKGVARTARRDFPAELAALTGMACVFSNNFAFQGGEYGNAVLTRFPVLRVANTPYQMLREGEQRGLMQLVLEIHGRELVFMNTHIDYRPDDAERMLNVGEIETRLKLYAGRPIMLCGDFNTTPESRVCRRLSESFEDSWARAGQGDGFTIPASQPTKRIDYIWITKDKSLEPLKVWVPQSDASDHLPVVAEFLFR
jgi:endonuclease/exonuclease/phosphatase family metal-dependent hydrolase